MIIDIDDLERFFDERKITKSAFSRECGFSDTYCYMILNGYIKLNERNSIIISKAFEKYGFKTATSLT